MAKSLTSLVVQDPLQYVHGDLIEPQLKLGISCKMTSTPRNRALSDENMSVENSIDIYTKRSARKKDELLTFQIAFSINRSALVVVATAQGGYRMKAVIEDIRLALTAESFAKFQQEGINTLDQRLLYIYGKRVTNDNMNILLKLQFLPNLKAPWWWLEDYSRCWQSDWSLWAWCELLLCRSSLRNV